MRVKETKERHLYKLKEKVGGMKMSIQIELSKTLSKTIPTFSRLLKNIVQN